MALLAAVLALLVVGGLAIYSASHVVSGMGKVLRQVIWGGIGLAGLALLAHVDYRVLLRSRRALYVLVLLALIFTLLVADPVNGARSWIDLGIFRLQPSEFGKVALILAFGALLHRLGPRVSTLPVFVRLFGLFLPPVFLVLAQPDFGTAMVYCAVWFVMVWVAGARWWMLTALCVGAVLTFTLAWHVGLVKDYQKKRLDFVHADPAGNGYHQRQARIAIGAGEFWGKGYLHGTQARRGFLPEQDTDFIFAVIGEEFGFLGALAVLGLYLFILFRLIRIAEEAETRFGQLIAAGVATMLTVHVVINVGMCLTLTPVTGVPLPFVSYGGSNLLTNCLAMGLVLNISRHCQARRSWAGDESPLIRTEL